LFGYKIQADTAKYVWKIFELHLRL